MFKRNEGVIDRIVRVGLGLVLVATGLYLLDGLQASVLGLSAAGLGVLGLITGLTGVCPLYIPLGINTLEKEREMMAKCKSMMAGFHQLPAGQASPHSEQLCGMCPPSIESNPGEQG